MAQIHDTFAEVDLFVRDGNYNGAKLLLTRYLEQNPSDREAKLYLLLVNVQQTGPVAHEEEIDALRTLPHLTEAEKEILRQIFVLGFKSAEHEGRQEQALVYQRLLRRLLLNQSLDQAIPRTDIRRTPAPQITATGKDHSIFADARHAASLRLFWPTMAGASATAANAIGQLREKIQLPWIPWHSAVREDTGSIAAALRRAGSAGTGAERDLGSIPTKAAGIFRRNAAPAERIDATRTPPWWKSPVHGRQTKIGVAAALLAAPLAYYLSVDHPSSGVVPEVAPPPAQAKATVPAPQAKTPIETTASDEPQPFSPEELGSRVTEQLPGLRRAYAAALRTNPDLMGSLSIRIKMDDEGNVVDAQAGNSRLSDADFAEIVVAEARKWRFLKHNGTGGVFKVPLLFVPDGMDPRTILRWERTVAAEEGKANLIRPVKTAAAEESDHAPLVTRSKEADLLTKAAGKSARKTDERSAKVVEYKTRRIVPLREEPRFSSETRENIGPGTPINVLETKGDWLKVKIRPAGSVGYVRKEYLAPVSGAE